MRSVAISAAFALLALSSLSARAADPSPACRDGAAVCRDAFVKLEQCQRENPDKPEACGAAKGETDTACRTDASACDRDGSRTPPRRTSRKG